MRDIRDEEVRFIEQNLDQPDVKEIVMECPHCKKTFDLCEQCNEPINEKNSTEGVCHECVPVCDVCGNDQTDCTCDSDDIDVDVELDSEEENAG